MTLTCKIIKFSVSRCHGAQYETTPYNSVAPERLSTPAQRDELHSAVAEEKEKSRKVNKLSRDSAV